MLLVLYVKYLKVLSGAKVERGWVPASQTRLTRIEGMMSVVSTRVDAAARVARKLVLAMLTLSRCSSARQSTAPSSELLELRSV